MAKKVIETLVTELTADGAKLKKEMDTSLKDAKAWGGSMTKIATGLKFGAIAGGAAAVTVLATMTSSAIATADAFDEQSQRVNIATEDLSAYTYQAQFAGVSSDELNGALLKLNKTSADAFNGVGKGAEAFEALGISVEGTDGKIKNNSQLLGEIADRFSELEDGPQKTALAMDIFGKSVGGKLVPMLNGGTEEMKFFREEAERLNLIVSSETGEAAGKFNDNIDKLKGAFDGFGNVLAEKALPVLVKVTDILADPATQKGFEKTATGVVNLGEMAMQAALQMLPLGRAVSFFTDLEFDVDWFDVDEIDSQEKALARLIERAKMLYGEDFKADDRFKFDPISDEIAKATMDLERQKKLLDMEKNKKPDEEKKKEVLPSAKESVTDNWEIEQKREIALMLEKEKKAQEAADREVLMQRDKFMRIHEEMLQADDKVVDLENYRHKRQQEELQKEMELLNEKGLLTAELEMEFQIAKEEQEAAHQSRLKNLKEQAHKEDVERQLVQLQGYESLFGSLGDIFDTFGARQSKARRLLLVAEKAAAIKSATISINEGIANSARLGFPQNIGAIAATVGATAGLIANIEDVGVAHGGLTNVPKEQTFFLDKGERVVSPKQNRDLTEFLRTQGGGNVTRIEVINNIPGVQMQATAEQDGEAMRLIITSMENKLRTDLSNGRGIWDQAKQKYGWSTKGRI